MHVSLYGSLPTDDSCGPTAHALSTTVTAGSRDRLTVATIGEGRSVVSQALQVQTVQDPGGDFDVALFNGEEKVTPEENRYTMTTDEVLIPGAARYDTGDDIDVELDGRDRTADTDVSVLVGVVPTDLLSD